MHFVIYYYVVNKQEIHRHQGGSQMYNYLRIYKPGPYRSLNSLLESEMKYLLGQYGSDWNLTQIGPTLVKVISEKK